MKKRIALFGLLNALLVNQANADCALTGASYIYEDNPAITARFLPLKHKSLTDVYFTITSSTGQDLWFTFDWGNGFSTERLVSSKTNPANPGWQAQDPDSNKDRLFADLEFFAFDKNLKVSLGKIQSGKPAPEYIFIPALAPTLWYLRDKTVFSDYQLARAMFKLDKCQP